MCGYEARAGNRGRTGGLKITNLALYQLSYPGTLNCLLRHNTQAGNTQPTAQTVVHDEQLAKGKAPQGEGIKLPTSTNLLLDELT